MMQTNINCGPSRFRGLENYAFELHFRRTWTQMGVLTVRYTMLMVFRIFSYSSEDLIMIASRILWSGRTIQIRKQLNFRK